MDSFSFQVANLLVGNHRHAAALELTILGPRVEFLAPALIALTGADMGMTLNDQPVGGWRSIPVQQGDVLDVHQVTSGCRAYLAVSGGIAVPPIMGSCSTYVGGQIGGFQGRVLQTDDILEMGIPGDLNRFFQLPDKWVPEYRDNVTIRAIPGPQDDFFNEGLTVLYDSEFMVTAKADRMGYRLQGPEIHLSENMPSSIISEPSVPGGIQIPADRQPIVLFVEQTVGGYVKIATVITSDLSVLAQTVPGDMVRFEKVDLKTAQSICNDNARRVEKIASWISKKRGA
jgi:biotin-dependent carboxylase-like uncharacterized protein